MVTDAQVKELWRWLSQGKTVTFAARKANMDRKTASKYVNETELPSSYREPRSYRTRANPFESVWSEVEAMLIDEPKLQAKTLFYWLQRQYPGKFDNSLLRTLQRHVKQWRALSGPPKEVFFPQVHEPGALGSSDFTHMNKLHITIGRQPFSHMLYHFVLTYSNWETAVICYSESFESLSQGLQTALWELGGVPHRHRSDRLSAAVQNLSDRREFTQRYQRLMDHYGLNGEKTNPSSPHENGDVEQSHYRLTEALDQSLLLRGSRDFRDVDEYTAFLRRTLADKNATRQKRFQEERCQLRALPACRLEHRKVYDVTVHDSSLVRIDRNVYSVPSRLIGERVRAVVDVEWIDIYCGQKVTARLPRLRGRGKSHVNYRHVIDSLVRKPGAFAGYKYQADLFPTTRFRIAYDELRRHAAPRAADKEYLAILYLAATEDEQAVDDVLRHLIENEREISARVVQEHMTKANGLSDVSDVNVEATRLSEFDSLFTCMEVWNDSQGCVGVPTEGTSFAGLS